MLSYARHAPWVGVLRGMPRLARWQVAPGRFMYLLLRCGDYAEGAPLGFGLPRANAFLHEDVIPAHESLGAEFPVSAIPLVGMYSDLSPDAPRKAAAKLGAVAEYNAQDWDYPRLVNATWAEFFDHVRSELGDPADPHRGGLRTVSGGTGSCWEAWMLRVQAESARFRRAQQEVVSARTLCAMLGRTDERDARRGWRRRPTSWCTWATTRGTAPRPESVALNLSIRRGRLDRLEAALAGVVQAPAVEEGARLAVVNVLDHARRCEVGLPDGLALADPESGERWPVVPAFGARRRGGVPRGRSAAVGRCAGNRFDGAAVARGRAESRR